jgi:hypothetical protein
MVIDLVNYLITITNLFIIVIIRFIRVIIIKQLSYYVLMN